MMAVAVALLVSDDAVALQQFSQALAELSISHEICKNGPAAIRQLNCQKFDALIVDLQLGEQSGEILDAAHHSPSNRTAVTFAICGSDGEGPGAFQKGAGFVFERPLSTQSIRSTLKPAYGLILRERRRYFRCPVSIPIVILRRSLPEVHCYSLNISEGGMAVSASAPIGPGETVQVQFTLPDHAAPFMAESTVRWSKARQLGIVFVSLSPECKSELQGWLSRKLEESLPEAVMEQFQKAEGCFLPNVRGGVEIETCTASSPSLKPT